MVLRVPAHVTSAPAAVRTEFERVAQPFALPAGRAVLGPGELCSGMSFIVEGAVRVYLIGENGREVTLYRVTDGEACVLTASCLLGQSEFPAAAIVETPVQGAAVPGPVFRDWVSRHSHWREYVFRLIATRLASVLGQMNDVVFQPLEARLARHLLQFSGGRAGPVCVTQEELAHELGSAREVISRVLGRWRESGMVDLEKGVVHLRSATALRDLSSRG
ncbi:MAG: Crp/Fnr family transcriptional regulator [Verrucomicrobiales bacterium]|nr:Crp/Fnr family transcriptional regulator [Verrucomicrobiales bacterium]